MASAIPEFDISLSRDNIPAATRDILVVLRPEWDYEKTSVKVTNLGFLNLVVLCYSDERKDPKDALVIKSCEEAFCGPFETWKHAVTFLNKHQLGVGVLAFLQNGVCMKMVDGESLEFGSARCLDVDFREKTAEEMARWHCQKVLVDAKESGVRRTSVLACDCENYWAQIFNEGKLRKYKSDYPTASQLYDAVDSYEKLLLDNGDLDEAFVHFDMNAANIFLNVDNGKGIEVIDFDFIGLSYAQHDLAWFFRIMNELTEPGSDHLPGEDYETKFIQHYLKNRNSMDGKPEPSSEDVKRFYTQVQKAKVLVNLRVIVCSTFILNEEKDFPDVAIESDGGMEKFIPVSIKMWKEFEQYKERVLKEFS